MLPVIFWSQSISPSNPSLRIRNDLLWWMTDTAVAASPVFRSRLCFESTPTFAQSSLSFMQNAVRDTGGIALILTPPKPLDSGQPGEGGRLDSNQTLNCGHSVSPCQQSRKPADQSISGLPVKKSREFRRRLELFVEGVAGWEPHITHLMTAA